MSDEKDPLTPEKDDTGTDAVNKKTLPEDENPVLREDIPISSSLELEAAKKVDTQSKPAQNQPKTPDNKNRNRIIAAIIALVALAAIVVAVIPKDSKPVDPELMKPPGQLDEGEEEVPPEDIPEDDDATVIADDAEYEIMDKLSEIAYAAKELYDDTIQFSTMLSKDGFLYNYAADIVTDADYLLEREFIDEEHYVPNTEVLYIFPKDLMAFDNVKIGGSPDLLNFYAVTSYEDGYLLSGVGGQRGKLTVEECEALLLKYKHEKAELTYYGGSAFEEKGFSDAINRFENLTNESYFVHHAATDGVYCVAIVTPKSTPGLMPAKFRQYVFELDGDAWEVVMGGIEEEPKPMVAINTNFPALDTFILPDYQIASFKNRMITDFIPIVTAFAEAGFIDESSSPIVYAAGTNDEFLYIHYEDNTGLYAYYDDERRTWVVPQYETAAEMAADMSSRSPGETPPLFILINNL